MLMDDIARGSGRHWRFRFRLFRRTQDFAQYFKFDGNNDMGKLDAWFDKRVASDPFAKAVQNGLPSRTSASITRCGHRRPSAAVRMTNGTSSG
jgi:hypothetical protein